MAALHFQVKSWLFFTPFAAASMVAISRTMDYRRTYFAPLSARPRDSRNPLQDHWHDVLVGSLLGAVVSYFAYRQYYPSLSSEMSHRPFSPRIKRAEDKDAVLPSHSRHPSAAPLYPGHVPQPGHVYRDGALEGTVRRPEPEPLRDVWNEEDPREDTAGGNANDHLQRTSEHTDAVKSDV